MTVTHGIITSAEILQAAMEVEARSPDESRSREAEVTRVLSRAFQPGRRYSQSSASLTCEHPRSDSQTTW